MQNTGEGSSSRAHAPIASSTQMDRLDDVGELEPNSFRLLDRSMSPPRSLPLREIPFSDWLLKIEYRKVITSGDDDSLSFSIIEPPTQIFTSMLPDLLAPKYREFRVKDWNPSMISFAIVCKQILEMLGLEVDLAKDELGYILPSPSDQVPSTYAAIASKIPELSLQSALSAIFNWKRTKEGQSTITLYLWDPIPTSAIVFEARNAVADAVFPKRKSIAPVATPSKNQTTSGPDPNAEPLGNDGDESEKSYKEKTPPLEQSPPPLETTHPPEQILPLPEKTPGHPPLEQISSPLETTHPPEQILPLPEKTPGHPPLEQISSPLEMTPLPTHDDGIEFHPSQMVGNTNPESIKPRRDDFNDDEEYNAAMQVWHEQEEQRNQRLDLADSTKCQHTEPPHWDNCSTFFKHNPQLLKPDYIVAIPRFKRRLLPIQAHSVWWALKMIHSDVMSLMICHSMGIGKTTITWAIHHVQHQLNQMWTEIFKDPVGHGWDEEAFDEGRPDEDMERKCPMNVQMNKDFGFDCPCVPSSPTHFVKYKPGISIILAPLSLLKTWQNEFYLCFGKDSNYSLLTAHHAYENKDPKAYVDKCWKLLQGEETPRMELAKEVRPNCKPLEKFESHEGPSIFEPRLQNGNCIVLSTPDSVTKKFLLAPKNQRRKDWVLREKPFEKITNGKIHTVHPNPKTITGKTYQSCIASMIFKDEFQHRPSVAVGAIKEILSWQLRDDFEDGDFDSVSVIPLSGTPLTRGPADLATWVQVMSKPTWAVDKVLHDFLGNRLTKMGKDWEKMIKRSASEDQKVQNENKKIRDQVRHDLPPLVEKLFVRSTTTSKLYAYPVVKVPIAKYRTILAQHNAASAEIANQLGKLQQAEFDRAEFEHHREHMRNPKNSEANYVPLSKSNVNTYYRSRVCASFPDLAALRDEETGKLLSLTQTEWITNVRNKKWIPGRTNGPDADPYAKALGKLVTNSGKIAAYAKELDRWDKQKDAEGKPTRHIMISYFFVVIYIFELWMLKYRNIPAEDMVIVNAWRTPNSNQTNEALARFHVDIDSKIPVEEQKTARYVLSTTSAISIGLTLAEAIEVTFLEPDYNAGKIAQGFARHCRQGNPNTVVWCNIIQVEQNFVEDKIMAMSDLRRQIEVVQQRKVETVTIDE